MSSAHRSVPRAHHSRRTFTACWTCRHRNVRCDKAVPRCSQCEDRKVECEGYDMRLVWVDSATGRYEPLSRRAYACDLTWRGYPELSSKDVDRLITECDGYAGDSKLQKTAAGLSPFSTFSHRTEDPRNRKTLTAASPASPESERAAYSRTRDEHTGVTSEICEYLFSNAEDRVTSPVEHVPTTQDRDRGSNAGFSPAINMLPPTDDSIYDASSYGHADGGDKTYVKSMLFDNDYRDNIIWSGTVPPASFSTILDGPAQSLTPSGNTMENRLFHHYLTYVSLIMMPVDDGRNPWKSTYPSMAITRSPTYSSQSLYHAILAEAAFNVAQLRGSHRGMVERSYGFRYFGMALKELRKSLLDPSQDYSSVLAALLTIVNVGNVFLRTSPEWRSHLRGAVDFVIQYIHRRPWDQSSDAWMITQNFALYMVIGQTASKCTAENDGILGPRSAGRIFELDELLCDVMKKSTFGFTIGGSARLIRLISQIRLIEKDIVCLGGEIDDSVLARADEIMDQLQVPIETEAEVFCKDDAGSVGTARARSQARMLINLHIHMFNAAVILYLQSVVLRRPPAHVVDYVWEVLSDMATFVSMQGTSVSVWPVFIAAAEAYTPASKELTEVFFQFSEKLGAQNRVDVQSVIRRVWKDREEQAAARECDQGDVIIDWREVMEDMELDILLL